MQMKSIDFRFEINKFTKCEKKILRSHEKTNVDFEVFELVNKLVFVTLRGSEMAVESERSTRSFFLSGKTKLPLHVGRAIDTIRCNHFPQSSPSLTISP